MLKEELFINKLDGKQLKRIYIDEIDSGDLKMHFIKEKATNILYEEVVVLPEYHIEDYEEVILEE